ncbi:MAG: mechanosensitive ion channel [Pseudomonadales bacterium]|nr:mechanosensitive ion channel [Pseudomonadales bacterium]MCP5193845.1 mechanosensitive ion channel [Pseudomonadales bacterium]
MAYATDIATQLESALQETMANIVASLPSIAAALLLLLVGVIAARLIRGLTLRLLHLLNLFLERILSGRTRAVVYFSSGITRLVAGILFWITLFVFVTAALKTAGLTGVAAWLERVVDFLPGIVTGGLIILVGYILAGLVRDVTLAAAHSAEFTEAVVISRLAQAITLITALVIGLDQIGIDVSFLTTMLGISSAALLFGFALAFGLGARTLVSNLVAAHHLRDVLEPGQDIRMGDWEGTVLEVSSTAVILDTEAGRVSVPAKLYQEQAVVLLLADAGRE